MKEFHYQILETEEFDEWFREQDARTKAQVAARIEKIQRHEHFGDHKSVSLYEKGVLKNAVWELRWKDGRRVYYAYTQTI